MDIKKISDYEYIVEKEGDMNVPVKVFASEKIMEKMKQDKTLQQGMNVACLPGIKRYSYIMPDGHQGYGFSIGGVAALDSKTGGISPGGIGFDINCGVRLLRTDVKKEDAVEKMEELLENIFAKVPAGVGKDSDIRLHPDELDELLNEGAKWAVRKGHGTDADLELCEEGGRLENAKPSYVSDKAKARGRSQVGTLGAGNHFLEVQTVDKIFDRKVAGTYGLEEGQVVVMIHCGSRGLGHQVCSDYLREMERTYPDLVKKLPERDLIYAPAGSAIARKYFGAMCAAANFAWCNRHVIGSRIRRSFSEVFAGSNVDTVYDIAHNIAKLEEHMVDGEKVEVYVHRKGATRAFGPGRDEIPERYREAGQPILIPGSMGTSSYVLAGSEKAMRESFGSTAHGAGRVMSRFKANKQFRGEAVKADLKGKGILIKNASWRGISEEAPQCYKDVDEVVRISHEAGIGKLVARLRPLGVIKG